MQSVLNFMVRLVLLAVGLLFAASLAIAVMVLLALWSLRMVWARLTGQPVTPFVMRMDPRGGFNRMYRAGPGRTPHEAQAPQPPQPPGRPGIADVTDVVPKEPRS